MLNPNYGIVFLALNQAYTFSFLMGMHTMSFTSLPDHLATLAGGACCLL